MPARRSSRSLRRIRVKLPGNTVKIQYKVRNPKQPHCAVTGQVLHGMPRASPKKLMNMPKTKKRPQRPFGGVLSSKASRMKIKAEARKN